MHGADLKEWEHASLSKLLLPGVAELVEHVVPPTPDLSLGLQEVSSKWNEHKRSSSINRWKDMISEAHRWTSRRKKKLVFDSQDMFIRLQSRFECRLQLARKKMWITRFSMDYRPVRDFEVLTNMTPPADYCVSLPELSTFLLFFTSSNDFVKFPWPETKTSVQAAIVELRVFPCKQWINTLFFCDNDKAFSTKSKHDSDTQQQQLLWREWNHLGVRDVAFGLAGSRRGYQFNCQCLPSGDDSIIQWASRAFLDLDKSRLLRVGSTSVLLF